MGHARTTPLALVAFVCAVLAAGCSGGTPTGPSAPDAPLFDGGGGDDWWRQNRGDGHDRRRKVGRVRSRHRQHNDGHVGELGCAVREWLVLA